MKYLSLFLTALTLMSCKDFTESKLTNGPNINKTVTNTQEILGDLTQINSGSFSLDKLILNTGLNIVFPAVENLDTKIEKLDSISKLYCDVVQKTPSSTYEENEALKTALKLSWKESMDAFHLIEAFKFGPILTNGEELGLSIYSWPLLNPCRVELEIAKNTGRDDYQLKTGVNLRGLGALEPILFTEEGKHNCTSAPDFFQSWLNSPKKNRHLDQCTYIKLITADLKIQTAALKKSWDPKFGNYSIRSLSGANLQKKITLVNELSNSLFYVEKILKDLKLGEPSGILNCSFSSCPEKTEHIIASYSIESILKNLQGFKFIFNGIDYQTSKNGFGLDDYLLNMGHPEIAKEMNLALENAISSFSKHLGKKSLYELSQGIDKTRCQATSSTERLVEICALYADVRELTSLLKNDYSLALRDIQAPKDSQGDMD